MKRTIQIAISLLLLLVLLTYVTDVEETLHALRRLDPRWALLGLLIMTADRVLMSYKWLLLLAVRGYRFSILDAMRLYCSAMVWGLALPSTVGADAVRIVLLRRRGVNVTDAMSSIMVERGIGFVAALALALLSLSLLQGIWPDASRYRGLFLVVGAVLAGGGMLLIFSFSGRAFEVFQTLMPARWRESGIVRRLGQLHEAYRSLGTQRSVIVVFTLLTLAEQLLTVPSIWAIGHGLGIELSLVALLGALPLALLLARLPVSFDGIGVFEGIFMAVLGQAGIRPAQSLAIAIASRVLQVIALLPWWIAHGLKRHTQPVARIQASSY